MKDLIRLALPNATVMPKGKDLIVKSNNREQSMKDLENFLGSKSVSYRYKESYKSSLGVLSIPLLGGDVVFKPIRAKGQGGRDFEDQIFKDLNDYFAGVDLNDLTHPDVIEELSKKLNLEPRLSGSAKHVGKQQNKRTLDYSLYGYGLDVKNNTGSTIADVIVTQGGKIFYLSLKYGKTYYSLNGSIGKYFSDNRTKKSINEYFGFDGLKMGGFGDEYSVTTEKPNYFYATSNLENVISQSVGMDLVIVHKKSKGDVLVEKVRWANVSVNGLNSNSYIYPVANKRKYANIRVDATIEGVRYNVDLQFRGTSASDKGPKYLRILMERK